MTFHLDRHEPRPVREELDHMAQTPVTISLPFPVSVNGMYRNFRGGRAKTERLKGWQVVAFSELARQRPGKISGHFEATIAVQKKDERKRDLDNLAKCVLDVCVEKGIVQDDSLITELHMAWADVDGCQVTIRPSEPRYGRRVA